MKLLRNLTIFSRLHTNALDAYDSLLKIKRVADIVVPNHDPDFQHGSRITL